MTEFELLLLIGIGAILLLLLIILGLLLWNSQSSAPAPEDLEQIILDYHNQPNSSIDSDVIINLTTNYNSKQLSAIEASIPIADATSVRFDLEFLKKFIYQTEINARKAGEDINEQTLGVRFYFASYPMADDAFRETAKWNQFASSIPEREIRIEDAGRHTLVLVPTIKRGDLHNDFSIAKNKNGHISLLENSVNEFSQNGVASFGGNHGQMWP